jgi:Sec-independent protein translocase protein TatA
VGPVLDINGAEFVVLALLAGLLLGPDRLPELARSAARLIRRGRDFATGASAQMKDEMGVDLDGSTAPLRPPPVPPEADRRERAERRLRRRRQPVLASQGRHGRLQASRGRPACRVLAGTAAARTGTGSRSGPGSGTGAAGSGSTSTSTSTAVRSGPGSASAQTVRTTTSDVPRRPSPPPTTWADAARRAGVDTDAT